jgi:hypothetical protein
MRKTAPSIESTGPVINNLEKVFQHIISFFHDNILTLRGLSFATDSLPQLKNKLGQKKYTEYKSQIEELIKKRESDGKTKTDTVLAK